MKENGADRAVCIDEFEKMIVSELERLKDPKPTRGFQASPKQKAFAKTIDRSARSISAVKGSQKSDLAQSAARDNIKLGKTPIFESTDYSSFKKLEKEVKKGFFDKEPTQKKQGLSKSPMAKHPYDSSLKAVEGDDSADKENQNVRNLIADKEEVSKIKKVAPGTKKSPWGAAPKQNSQNTSQTDEACNFMPKLSKNSMIIASSLGDPLERLTAKKKTPIKRPKQVENEEPTFTPKINSKSILIDNSKRDRSANRFLVLHEQSKREKRRMEHVQAKDAEEEQACAFHPQLVTAYAPEHLNELGFLERSYLWKKRVEQKIEVQRKLKEEVAENSFGGTGQQPSSFSGTGYGATSQPEMVVAKLSPPTTGPVLKSIPLSVVDPHTKTHRDRESASPQPRVLQARRVNESVSSRCIDPAGARAANLTMELNSFFNLDKDTVQQRKLSHKYLH